MLPYSSTTDTLINGVLLPIFNTWFKFFPRGRLAITIATVGHTLRFFPHQSVHAGSRKTPAVDKRATLITKEGICV